MLLDIAVKSLWRRRLRSILTILGVAMAVQLYITMSGIMSWYNSDVQRQLSAFAGKVYIQQRMGDAGSGEDFPSTTSSFSTDTASAILNLEGVDRSASSAVLTSAIALSPSPNAAPSILAVGLEPGHETAFLGNAEIADGAPHLDASDSAILGATAAVHYQNDGSGKALQPGQVFQLRGQAFKVAGVLKSSSQLFNGIVVIPLATAQKMFNRPDTVSAVVLTAASMGKVESLKQEIGSRFPKLEASSQDDLIRNADDVLANQRAFFKMINSTVILTAIIAITIVVFIAVMEQRKEIGTLRAIGARRWRILTLVVGEALILSMAGAVLALPLSTLMARTLLAYVTGEIMDTVSIWLTSLSLAIVIGTLASLLPAWLALRVSPLEALRYE